MERKDFNIFIENVKSVLKKQGLLMNCDFYRKKVSCDFINISKKGNYLNAYKTATRKLDYHFLLTDESFFQFELLKDATKSRLIRYAYYGFPFDFPTYSEYLSERGVGFGDVGYTFKKQYEQSLSEAKLKKNTICIRYDYSEKEYLEGVHSVSHFHMDYYSSIRVPSKKIVSPLLFTIFVVKQAYPKQWNSIIQDKEFLKHYKACKDGCDDVQKDFFKELDAKSLYLH